MIRLHRDRTAILACDRRIINADNNSTYYNVTP